MLWQLSCGLEQLIGTGGKAELVGAWDVDEVVLGSILIDVLVKNELGVVLVTLEGRSPGMLVDVSSPQT